MQEEEGERRTAPPVPKFLQESFYLRKRDPAASRQNLHSPTFYFSNASPRTPKLTAPRSTASPFKSYSDMTASLVKASKLLTKHRFADKARPKEARVVPEEVPKKGLERILVPTFLRGEDDEPNYQRF